MSVVKAIAPGDPPLVLWFFVLYLQFVRNLIIAFENGPRASLFALTWVLRKHRLVFFSDRGHVCVQMTAVMQTLQRPYQFTRNIPNPEPLLSSFQLFISPSDTVI